MFKGVQIIAEVKTKSPFGFKSDKSWDQLFQIADHIGDLISVHTDPRWDGSTDLVRRARGLTRKPILAKGMHQSDEEIEDALAAGADFVLVVGRVPEKYRERLLIEPLNLKQFKSLPANIKVVWNERNLDTGEPKTETFEMARQIWPGWLCQASFLKTIGDIKPGAQAVLVGANLLEFADSLPKD